MSDKKLIATLAVFILLAPFTFTLHAKQSSDDVDNRKVDIISEGTRMTGHIFTLKSVGSKGRLPTIVMAQGWGGRQSSLFRDAV